MNCKMYFFPRPVELVFADQVRETLIASLSVATAIIASILLLVNLCVKHQRPVLSLVAVLLTFISGEYDLTIFLFVCLCEWNSFSLFFLKVSLLIILIYTSCILIWLRTKEKFRARKKVNVVLYSSIINYDVWYLIRI